jgi:hypothetical protein
MHRDHQNTYYTYVYRITHLWHRIHYYGVRHAIQKYSGIALEDLRIYQSSSRNREFKEELKLHPELFNFKLLKVFRTNRQYEFGNNIDFNGCIISQARKLEIKLQRKFQVDTNRKFYNMSIIEFEGGSEWDEVTIWDLENDCEYVVESAREFSKEFGPIL